LVRQGARTVRNRPRGTQRAPCRQAARPRVALLRHRAPTGCRHTVSGSISLPFRGSFHLSLSVLVHYRSLRVFSLRRWSSQIHSGHLVSAATWGHGRETPGLSLTGLLPSMARLSQTGSARSVFCNSRHGIPGKPGSRVGSALGRRLAGPATPHEQRHQSFSTHAVWAVPSSLAATRGIAVAFFSSGY
jgi:hypothetical protein